MKSSIALIVTFISLAAGSRSSVLVHRSSVLGHPWMQRADLPLGHSGKRVKEGGCLAYTDRANSQGAIGPCPLATGSIYALKGNNTCEFYEYDQDGSCWFERTGIPERGRAGKMKRVKKGACMTGAQSNAYVAKGNHSLEFWQYAPDSVVNPWIQLADIPAGAKDLREGASATTVNISNVAFVYLLKGSDTREFYCYDPIRDTWLLRPEAPKGPSRTGYKDGSCIAFDGVNTIYALKARNNEFYAYDVAENFWVEKPRLPYIGRSRAKKQARQGAGLACAEGSVYALKGGNSLESWRYDAAQDSWTQIEDMPEGNGMRVSEGGALVAARNALYALKGNNTLEFYRYSVAARPQQAPQGPENASSSAECGMRNAELRIAPNPVTSSAVVHYTLPKAGCISLKLYDIKGQLVSVLASGCHNAGLKTFNFQPSTLGFASGIYLLKLETGTATTTAKLIIE